MEFQLVNPKIIEEISRKLSRLQNLDSCAFRAFISKRHVDSLERDAVLHSYKIEHPNNNSTRYNTHSNNRNKKRGIRDLENAFRWASNTLVDPSRIDEGFIVELAGKIDPDFHKNKPAEYRLLGLMDVRGEIHLTGVRPLGAKFTPPYPEKLPKEMKSFEAELQSILFDKSLNSLVEGAIYAHLQLVRIHPFEDTNGRTARTLQNLILKYSGLPPPIIYAGERFDYYF